MRELAVESVGVTRNLLTAVVAGVPSPNPSQDLHRTMASLPREQPRVGALEASGRDRFLSATGCEVLFFETRGLWADPVRDSVGHCK